jgi:hypothetical protein
MTMPWLAELNGGWNEARAAFLKHGASVAAAEVAVYLGLALDEPLDARIAGHVFAGLYLTRGRIRPGRRSMTFSWPNDGEGGAACWLYPLWDGAANLIEVLAFDVEGRPDTDVFSYGESVTALGLDPEERSLDAAASKRVVMIARPRAWFRFWIQGLRERAAAARITLCRSSPENSAALIVRPWAMDFSPVRRERAPWAHGVDEVVVIGADLGEQVAQAFSAAAANVLPELKVSKAKGGAA